MTSHIPIDRTLRIAFIGAGQMARNHLAAIQRLPLPVAIVGVTDRVPTVADQFASLAGVRQSVSIETLLADTQPDIVHVCTPPSAHFEAAHAALDFGAHVYVEKPFALTTDDASALIALAAARRRLLCAGHQLLRDAAFETLIARLPELGTVVQIDSHFAFRPVGPSARRGDVRALEEQAVDILPHPLYTLIHVLERCNPTGAPIDIVWAHTNSADLHATLRTGETIGRLSVSLRSRPVSSYLTVTGTHGSLTCDFVRSIVIGAANAGTQPLEKILNPALEGWQLASRTAMSLGRRLRSGTAYPGLSSLIEAFYREASCNGRSPIAPEHLLRVTAIFEQLVNRIQTTACAPAPARPRPPRIPAPPRIAVTGASGFLGTEIARAVGRVRAVSRGANPDRTHEWVMADLGSGLEPEALAGIDVVVHAAAETAGGFEAHQRNTIDATRHLLRAMRAAGVSRLVLVSSLSVIRPPRTAWERQNESTPRARDARRYGPYTWGKSRQEEIVDREGPALGIAVRIVRPGALLDWNELPGLMGRHLYGRWHLGLGRPSLPIAVCDVARCADAIAWCATHFDEAPPIVNLMDPALMTRREVAVEMRRRGWRGQIVWVPISVLSFAIASARTILSLGRGKWPEKFSVWSVLKPRRFDARLATTLLDATTSSDADRLAIGA
jgi:predicted dehydrogenase/nucleoside-diphosphate-sugar epimerase